MIWIEQQQEQTDRAVKRGMGECVERVKRLIALGFVFKPGAKACDTMPLVMIWSDEQMK